jgi:hypothetical protein
VWVAGEAQPGHRQLGYPGRGAGGVARSSPDAAELGGLASVVGQPTAGGEPYLCRLCAAAPPRLGTDFTNLFTLKSELIEIANNIFYHFPDAKAGQT